MQNLSQRDSRWGNIAIGHSASKIKDFGCTLTTLAILANTTPDVINAFLTAVDGFLVDRIIWQKLNETKLGLHFPDNGRQYTYNDVAVRDAINLYGGCLVEVDYDGVISTPNDRHWVLYIGNQKLIDPWDGKIKSTSTYPLVKGYAIIQTNDENSGNLTSDQERALNLLEGYKSSNKNLKDGNLEGTVNTLVGWAKDLELYKGQIQTFQEKIKGLEASQIDLQKQMDDLKLKLQEEQKSEADWQKAINTANEQLQNELEQNALIDDDRKKYKRLYEEALQKFPSSYSWKDIINLIIKKLKSYDRKS